MQNAKCLIIGNETAKCLTVAIIVTKSLNASWLRVRKYAWSYTFIPAVRLHGMVLCVSGMYLFLKFLGILLAPIRGIQVNKVNKKLKLF
jgi:hypothetical protein